MHLNCVIVVISRESGHNNNTVPVLKWLHVCTSILHCRPRVGTGSRSVT